MSLEDYWRKRDFGKTTEPAGEKQGNQENIYVIQRHDATHLHYDLRLEMDGVLKSWAVPKTPPTESGTKRLAIQVEDHPIEYANFEGEIPKGQYGAGTVEIWDKGVYIVKDRKGDKLIFELRGRRLKGLYCLVRFRGKKNWLFFKKREA